MKVTTLFWFCLLVIVYNYIGYTLLMAIIAFFKRMFFHKPAIQSDYTPEVTLLIPAYNEIDYIDSKTLNTNKLNYPEDKLKVIWVTDGSNDGSVERLKAIPNITVLHDEKRNGKIGAVNRAMDFIVTPIVIFCDANSMLNENCIQEIVKPFQNKNVGCVAGQKKIVYQKQDRAVGSGEGIYWGYESIIKNLESYVNSSVGAAGELFAIRKELYTKISSDSIIEDFVISLSIIEKSYKTKYAPFAVSTETASLNIQEEMKRKIRIAYGSIQTLFRYLNILNPFKYGFYSFQYFSHKVLRWTLVPFLIPLIFILNIILLTGNDSNIIYHIFFYFQCIFYFLVFMGLILRNYKTSARIIFIPYYLIIMNLSIIKGYIRFMGSNQSVSWEKAKRS